MLSPSLPSSLSLALSLSQAFPLAPSVCPSLFWRPVACVLPSRFAVPICVRVAAK